MRLSVDYLATLPDFLAWFFTAVGTSCALTLLYSLITPWREFRLIREGNTAAALSFAGILTGYALVLSSVIRSAVSRGDMLTWGIVGLAVPLLALAAARLVIGPAMRERVERGDIAAGIVLASLSLAFGLLNAATMTPDAPPPPRAMGVP